MAEEGEKKKKQVKPGTFLAELLSGIIISDRIILRNLGYISLITLLAAIYIANRFHAEKITRQTSKLEREVRDLKAESLSTSALLMNVSRQSEVYRRVRENGLDLEELKTPPYKILVDKK